MIIYSDTLILIYSIVLAVIVGAVAGSFLNCVAWRIAHGENFLKGRSHCPKCGHTLGLADLIPIFSYIFLRGKCRFCKEKISPRYLISELLMAAVTVICLLQCDISPLFLRNFIFFCCLFCLAIVDLEIYEIPNTCIIAGILIWAVYIPFVKQSDLNVFSNAIFHLESAPLTYLLNGLLGGVVIAAAILLITLLMEKILKKEAMGGGDIKLYFLCGLYLGLIAGVLAVIVSCVIGLIFAVIRMRGADEEETEETQEEETEEKAPTKGAIPFGPAIAVAAWAILSFGQPLIEWYMKLIG